MAIKISHRMSDEFWAGDPNRDLWVITTNIGWKTNGDAVMGAGVAKMAADRYPDLASWYGNTCMALGADTPVLKHPAYPLILAPTKPLDMDQPHLSWRGDSGTKLIWRSCAQLAAFFCAGMIHVPLLGCGQGNLSPEISLPIMLTFLNHPRFKLVYTSRDSSTVYPILFGQWTEWLLLDDPQPKSRSTDSIGTHIAKID